MDFAKVAQYISQHCNQDYVIHIDTVKVEILEKAPKDKQGHEDEKLSGLLKDNRGMHRDNT